MDIPDDVFDLLGDYNNDGITDVAPADVVSADYVVWRDTNGSTTDLRADGNDDGVVNNLDYDLWSSKFSFYLMLQGVA